MTASSPPDGIPMGHLPDQGLTQLYDLLIAFNAELDAQERESLERQATA